MKSYFILNLLKQLPKVINTSCFYHQRSPPRSMRMMINVVAYICSRAADAWLQRCLKAIRKCLDHW